MTEKQLDELKEIQQALISKSFDLSDLVDELIGRAWNNPEKISDAIDLLDRSIETLQKVIEEEE